ncbi:hypothetical protein A9264_09250 [Vibrio sp. UCD-FRSSP16_10]|uniref:DUF3024 domain-containing protein n=1 Tax=unclassified Vibrio TaxID=2614977 RepID=UPI0008022158|nr:MULTISPECIES: hypothetical protein [unclassified Vibrio]OBT09444.1 hypothetical protein A9260_06350 [Vibrio sp. UCD-FRSSP16_30]OBT22123.1 hypothetical protein A9264_09250 [Vibrio sp. UCD-FRSSP16_10]
MALSEIERHQMVKLADGACHSRNNNVCVDLGKAEFAELDNGIEFYQTRFKLDSSQADHRYLVAKVVLCEGLWTLLVAHRDHYEMFEGWHTHPEIKRLGNQLHQLIEEVEHDSQGLIW